MATLIVDRAERRYKLEPLLAALALFGAWTVATWLLEGRLHTLRRPEATTLRLAYAALVNIGLGVGASAWLLSWVRRRGLLSPSRSGLTLSRKTPFAILAGLAIGAGLYAMQGAPNWDPFVLANAFAQVFVVSTAEVLICWGVVGNLTRRLLRRRSHHRWRATAFATVFASALFGLYHFGHSPPFDTWPMVGLLAGVGLLTGTFFFASRDLWGTVVFHNTLGVYGVVAALAEQHRLWTFQTLTPALFGTAAVAIVAVVAMQWRLGMRRPA